MIKSDHDFQINMVTHLATVLLCFALLSGLGCTSSPHKQYEIDITTDLPRAETMLIDNHFLAVIDLLEPARQARCIPDSLKGEVYRDLAWAYHARLSNRLAAETIADAVLADPTYPLNPILLDLLESKIVDIGTTPELRKKLSELKELSAVHPRLQGMTWLILAADADIRGKPAEVTLYSDKIHPIRKFIATGPFENAGGSGIDVPYPPEQGFDPDDRYFDRRGREVGWYPCEAKLYGTVNLDGFFDNEPDAIGYLATNLRSKENRDALLNISGCGSVRVWLNGELVLDEPKERGSVHLQYCLPIKLTEGWNSLLIKRGAQKKNLYNFCWISDTAGRPMKLDQNTEPPGGRPFPPSLAIVPPQGLDRFPGNSPLHDINTLTAECGFSDFMILCQGLLKRGFLEDVDNLLKRADPRWSNSGLLKSALADLHGYRRSGLSDGVWREVRLLAPEYIGARILRITDLSQSGDIDEMMVEVDALAAEVKDNPWPKALQGLADVVRGEPTLGLKRARAARKMNPLSKSVIRTYLNILTKLNDQDLYEKGLVECLKSRPDMADLFRTLAALHYNKGEYAKAAKNLERGLACGGSRLLTCADFASVYERGGDGEKALAACKQGMRWSPLSSYFPYTAALILLRMGENDRALSYLDQAMKLAPQQMELRELIRRVENKPNLKDYFPKCDLDSLIATAQLDWVPPTANTVYLLDDQQYLIYPDGVSESRYHFAIKVLKEGGVDEYRKVSVVDERLPGRKLEIARLHKSDGREVEAERGYGEVIFPDLEPGDILEIRSTVSLLPYTGLGQNFWASHYFQQREPVHHSSFSLLCPESTALQVKSHNCELEAQKKSFAEGWQLWNWQAERMLADEPESGAPHYSEYFHWLDSSSVQGWGEIVDWIDGNFRGPSRISPPIQSLADSLTKAALTDSARIHMITEYVRESVRYEDGQFVDWGVTPRSAEVTLRGQYGDCKDQTCLVIAMLQASGVKAHPVLITVATGRKLKFLPSVRFDHSFVRAETDAGEIFWIDTTSRGLCFPNIPSHLEGCEVLVIDTSLDDPLSVVGVDRPLDNGHVINNKLRLVGEDMYHLSGEGRFQGEDAAFFRRLQHQDAAKLDQSLRSWFGEMYPGAMVDNIALDFESSGGAKLSYMVQFPSNVTRAGDLLLLSIPWMMPNVPEEEASLESRKLALILGSWKGIYKENLQFELPENFSLESDQATDQISCANGKYKLQRTLKDTQMLELNRRLHISGLEVTAADYPNFREFVGEMIKFDKELVVLRQGE